MSLTEVLHRVVRSTSTRLESAGFFLAYAPPAPVIQGMLRPMFSGNTSEVTGAYEAAAKRLLAGHESAFAYSGERREKNPDWNRDPLSGTSVPLTFGKNIDYRDEKAVGNIKYLWEQNRHLELVTLAQAFSRTNDEKYLLGVGERIDSWLTQCPYPKGINWVSSLEVGIRLINWSIVWQLIGGYQSLLFAEIKGKTLRDRWLDSVFQHVHFIDHYYSRYSSANNHLIGEAAGVFVATCAWPYWSEFRRWGETAREILIRETELQTHEDGVNREQAISYQQFVLDFLVISALAGRARGIEFPDGYWCTIEHMINYVQSVMDPAGNVPMFGDADDGFVVCLSQEPDFCPFRSLLATGAILFDRQDFACKARRLDDKTRFLVGADKWEELTSTEGRISTPVQHAFPDGGYYIIGKDLDEENEIRIVTDAGPLGFLSIAAHGHADALSFVLSVAGREILVDPGTFCYHTEPHWRQYFRGTGAHNTVRIDGEDQSVQGGNFMWLRHASARCLDFRSEEQGGYFLGEHDGYCRLSDPVIHRREIVQHGTMIDVTDWIVCNGYHAAERCWHFSEDCKVFQEGSVIIAEHGPVRVAIRAEEVGEIRVLRASEEPPGGWVSRGFDVKVPSTSVYFLDEIRGTTSLRTRIECRIDREDS